MNTKTVWLVMVEKASGNDYPTYGIYAICETKEIAQKVLDTEIPAGEGYITDEDMRC